METHPRYRLEINDPFEATCEEAGIRSVADVLEHAECIRDLPKRANLRLRLGDRLVHVKHYKRRSLRPWTACPEAIGLIWAEIHEMPVPTWVFAGYDRALGAVVGTLDLAPARPLDDLLSEGLLAGDVRRSTRLSLARWVAQLHEFRVHHRDLYLNHVFVDLEAEDPVVALIDWDRFEEHRRPWGRWVVKDLAALLVSIPEGTVGPTGRLLFLYDYAIIRMHPEPLDLDFLRRLAVRVEKKAARMRRHVPRTPVGEAARPKERTA